MTAYNPTLDQYNADLALYHGLAAHAPITQAQLDAMKASGNGVILPGELSGIESGDLGAFRQQQANQYAQQQAQKLAGLNTGFGGMLSTLQSNPVTQAIEAAFLGPTVGSLTGLTAGGVAAFPGAAEAASALSGAGIGGATSAATGGNILSGALKGGALAGLGSGLMNNFGDITSGLGLTGTNTAGQSFGQVSGLNGLTGMNAGDEMSGQSPTGAAPTGSNVYGPTQAVTTAGQLPWNSSAPLSAGEQGLLNNAAGSAASTATPTGDGGGLSKFLSGALSKITNNPLAAAGALAAVANSLQQGKVAGTQDQGAILAQQQAKQAQDAAFSQQTINMLNAASTGRSPVNPKITDYYTYGTRPEATFFSQANPIHY